MRTKIKRREIVGQQKKGPVSYKKSAVEIRVDLSLMELFKISQDLSKAFRTLSTRINENTVRKRMKNELPKTNGKEPSSVCNSEFVGWNYDCAR